MASDKGDTTRKNGAGEAAVASPASGAAAVAGEPRGAAERVGEPQGAAERVGEPQGAAERQTTDLKTRVQELEAELERRAEEAKANYDRYLRERADLENFKKRAAREREEVVRYATEPLVRSLLPVIDNLERAVEHAATGGNGQPLIAGVNLVLKGLRDALEQYGVRAVTAVGERFDPAIHEAMEQVDSAEHEPNTVIREHQKGYVLHDRLLRPALVGVSRRPAAGDGPQGSGDT